jgi:hypothetical protein
LIDGYDLVAGDGWPRRLPALSEPILCRSNPLLHALDPQTYNDES